LETIRNNRLTTGKPLAEVYTGNVLEQFVILQNNH